MDLSPTIYVLLTLVLQTLASKVDDLLNKCIQSNFHKTQPGKESALFNYCSPWKERSCCTEEVAQALSTSSKWKNFDWHHCGLLSPRCVQHFTKDLCFYQCSPNLGPWIVPDKRKLRKERYVGVPLCRTTCNSWWDACKRDLTCLVNWADHFNWSTGVNRCPVDKPCKTFEIIFGTAERFCQGIWNNSFKVVEDSEDCFRLWFSAEETNPNDAVARRYAEKLLGITSAQSPLLPSLLVVFSASLLGYCFSLLLFSSNFDFLNFTNF